MCSVRIAGNSAVGGVSLSPSAMVEAANGSSLAAASGGTVPGRF